MAVPFSASFFALPYIVIASPKYPSLSKYHTMSSWSLVCIGLEGSGSCPLACISDVRGANVYGGGREMIGGGRYIVERVSESSIESWEERKSGQSI